MARPPSLSSLLLGTLIILQFSRSLLADYSLNCAMYNKRCTWDGVDQWKWASTTSKLTYQLTGPVSPESLVADFSQLNGTSKTFTLTSPSINPVNSGLTNAPQKCFSFYYYIMVDDSSDTELRLSKFPTGSPSSLTSLWFSSRRNVDQWGVASVSLDYATNQQLKFTAKAREGFIALYGFQLRDGKCDTRICNLESDDCGWTTDGTPYNYAFKVVKANNSDLKLKRDHTTHTANGNLGYLVDGKAGGIARVTSPEMENLGTQCFGFWFQRSGGNNVQMKVLLYHSAQNFYETIWTSEPARHLTDEWINIQNTVNIVGKVSVIIQATKLNDQPTVIAIDDLTFDPYACPIPIDCSYYRLDASIRSYGSFCNWKDETVKSDRLWSLGIGRVQNAAALNISQPFYSNPQSLLYTDFSTIKDTTKGSVMEIMSEFVDSNTFTGGACLTLNMIAYTITLPQDSLVLDQIDTLGNRKTLWTLAQTDITDPRMVRYKTIPIFIPNAGGNLPYRLSLKATSFHASTYIVINGAAYNQEAWSCNNAISRPPATPTTPFPTVNPILSLNNNFEGGNLGNWQPLSSSGRGFLVGTAADFKNSLYFPTQDHTLNNTNTGHFAYYTRTPPTPGQFAPVNVTLTGTNPYPTGYACVRFFYYFYAAPGANFSFQIQDHRIGSPRIYYQQFKAFGAYDIRWHEATVTLNPIFGNLRFEAFINEGVIALDDITVSPGYCNQPINQGYQLNCDFENFCQGLDQVYTNRQPAVYWKYLQGKNISRTMIDHTTHTNDGHFFGLIFGLQPWTNTSATKFQVKTKTYSNINAQSPQFRIQCMSFAYYTDNLTTNISLYYDIYSYYKEEGLPPTIRGFQVSGSTSGMWFTHHYPIIQYLPNYRYFYVVFTIDTGINDPGRAKIFIDDFSISSDSCNITSIICDFEAGDPCDMEPVLMGQNRFTPVKKQQLTQTGNWTKISKTNLVDYADLAWHVFTPAQSADYIQHDHTIGGKAGKYLLLHSPKPYDRGIMVTRRYQPYAMNTNTSFCFSFALFKPNPSSVFEVYQGEPSDPANALKLLDIRGTTVPDWRVYDIETSFQDPDSEDIFFYLVGTLGAGDQPNDYLALDDVRMVQDRPCKPDNSPRPDFSNSKAPKPGIIATAILVPVALILVGVAGYFGFKRYQAKNGGGSGEQVLSFANGDH